MQPTLVDVEALILEATELEPLPASTIRLAGLVARGDAELSEIADTIRLDEALTGRLLGMANSVRSGARVDIGTVEEAVMRLGPGQILAIALGSRLDRSLGEALPGYDLSEGELWRHSVAAALAVDRSRRYCRRSPEPEAFAAALLHDIGKLVLARHLSPPARAAVLRVREERGLSTDEAERIALGIGHAELGARIARNWGLPETIALAIRHHHAPLDAPDEPSRKLCSHILLADAVASQVDAPCDGRNQGRLGFSPAIAGSLGISQVGFEELCQDVRAQLVEVIATYAA